MGLTTINGEIISQPLNDNFSNLNQRINDLAINVKDPEYGAVGNGITDDTNAFTSALSDGAGKSVYIPDGNYIITQPLTIQAGTYLYGSGAFYSFSPTTKGTTLSISHTGIGLNIENGVVLEGFTIYYPDQVTTSPPTVYDYTINYTPYSGQTVTYGCIIHNLQIINAYNGIDLGGDASDGNPSTGGHVINKLKMFALNIGFNLGHTLTNIQISDTVLSPEMWIDSIGQAVREWTLTNGTAYFVLAGPIVPQFSNVTMFGHRRGLYFTSSVTDASKNSAAFLKANGLIIDGCLRCIEFADYVGLGDGSFSGCTFAAANYLDATDGTAIVLYLNNPNNTIYGTFSGCNFSGSSGSHIVISGSNAVFPRIIFSGCTIRNANRNNLAGTYYNVSCNDTRATLIFSGCIVENTYASTIENFYIPNIKNFMIDGLIMNDTASVPFNITTVANILSIKGLSSLSVIASTLPSSSTRTVASASTLNLPHDTVDLFIITGTTGITTITASWPGRIVNLKFNGSLTLTDGSNLKLAGNFTTSADDTLTLVCDGTNWYEISRSAN